MSGTTLKSRVTGVQQFTDHHLYGSPTFKTVYQERAEMLSQNHFPLNPDGDTGGPFQLTKVGDYASFLHKPHNGSCYNWHGDITVRHSDGPFTPSDVGSFTVPTNSTLMSLGSTAISRCAPSVPSFSLPTAAGELLFDQMPRIPWSTWKERTGAASGAGGEYLNTQFGWLPLVNDITSFSKTLINCHSLLESYIKGSDSKQRRRYAFPDKDYTGVSPMGYLFTEPAAGVASLFGQTMLRRTQKTWFSGAFRYHIPVADSPLSQMRRSYSLARHLLGIELTPAVVWNLAPWSWAADWFGNFSDVMTNVSAMGSDGLVMQYGYVMCETITDLWSYGRVTDSRLTSMYNQITARRTLYKSAQRLQATPYGFGVNMSALSPRQIAILTAIGISR